jgi:hypothetical protein
MFRRGIGAADVEHVIAVGETIEDYPSDVPFLSRLMLGWRGGHPLHVVVAEKPTGELIVITTYEPDPGQWDSTFRTRQP